jgi:hypothetical protein
MKAIAFLLYMLHLLIVTAAFPIQQLANICYYGEAPQWLGDWNMYFVYQVDTMIFIRIPMDLLFIIGLLFDGFIVSFLNKLYNDRYKSSPVGSDADPS